MSGATDRETSVLRTFVAIALPGGVRAQAAVAIDRCRGHLPRTSVRWVRAENLHLTLVFLGHVPVSDLMTIQNALAQAVRGASPFSLQLGGLGQFPEGRAPRVLWAGVQGELGPLKALQARVATATNAWAPADEREFHPHLTLGRVITRRRQELEETAAVWAGISLPPGDEWLVDEFHLIKSQLAPEGSIYSGLADFPLTK